MTVFSSEPRFSVVMPVYREGPSIVHALDGLRAQMPPSSEVLVVYDFDEDPTVPHLRAYATADDRVRPILNTYGRGPANALRFGLGAAMAPVVVVTMADGSDDPADIPRLVALIEGGASVAAASRYVAGGRQEGGPLLKRTMSRFAGWSLHRFAGVPIHDATSAFKAYATSFLRSIEIQSTQGFEISLELVAKAHRMRLPMAETPTVWRDRTEGASNFRLAKWLPQYLRWYRFAFGRQLSPAELSSMTKARSG